MSAYEGWALVIEFPARDEILHGLRIVAFAQIRAIDAVCLLDLGHIEFR